MCGLLRGSCPDNYVYAFPKEGGGGGGGGDGFVGVDMVVWGMGYGLQARGGG
jgi:hypothetical protein